MKLFDNNREVESIEIKYKNGKSYAIWLPKEVEVALKLLVDEDEDGNYTEDDLSCEFNIHCNAKWDNVNMIEV